MDAGVGDDILIGGAGADFLSGGTGGDTLIGGLQVDRLMAERTTTTCWAAPAPSVYHFENTFGSDTIDDSGDGEGVIEVAGLGTLTGAGTKRTLRYVDQRRRRRQLRGGRRGASQQLIITVASGANAGRITIRNWSSGQLGVTLDGGTDIDGLPVHPVASPCGSRPIPTMATFSTVARATTTSAQAPELTSPMGEGDDEIDGIAGADVLRGGGGAELHPRRRHRDRGLPEQHAGFLSCGRRDRRRCGQRQPARPGR